MLSRYASKAALLICGLAFCSSPAMAQFKLKDLANKAKEVAAEASSDKKTEAQKSEAEVPVAKSQATPAPKFQPVPKSAYKGKDRAALEKNMAAVYNKRYADEKIKKVIITDEAWETKQEWIDGRKVNVNYLASSVIIDKGTKCTLFEMRFKKVGGGTLEMAGIGDSYAVDPADVK